MPLVHANGLQFNTCRIGSGPPLVMLHGLLLGNLATWYFSSAPALSLTHEVLLYDLRGHGRSQRTPNGYDLSTMTADLHALTAGFDQPLTLVGHSYGALIALRFTLDHPERVARLVMVEAPLPPGSLTEIAGFVKQDPDMMVEAMPQVLADAVRRPGRRADKLLNSLRYLSMETTLLDDIAAEPDVTDARLTTITCPVLSIYGSTSQCRSVGARFVDTIPNCRNVVLPGGHFLPLEAPKQVTHSVEQFVNG